LGYDSFKGMGVDFADIDARGLLDIFVSNITESYALEESNFVFMNTGRSGDLAKGTAPFIDQSEARGLSRSGWSWDAKLDDFDNSGQLEVLQATRFVRGSVDRWPELQELAMANDQFLHEPRAWLRVMPGDDLSGQDHNPFYVADKDGYYVNIAPELGLEPADKPAPFARHCHRRRVRRRKAGLRGGEPTGRHGFLPEPFACTAPFPRPIVAPADCGTGWPADAGKPSQR
jgi:hypothetical protein